MVDARDLTDVGCPWWAVSMLAIPKQSDHDRVRRLAQRGRLHQIHQMPELSRLWSEVVAKAVAVANSGSIQDWIKKAPEACRWGAMESPRAFVQFANILDDTLRVPTLKDFHVRAVLHMREQQDAVILLPFSHGKSWLASMVVPFMDWAENAEFTEGRIYFGYDFSRTYTVKLMQEIERNEQMRALWPQIRRPIKANRPKGIAGDPCQGFWSQRGFSIGGKQAIEMSFEPLTVGRAVTGKRYWRTVCDDWVNSDNCDSVAQQDKMWSYFNTGPKTMGRVAPNFRSHHGTRAGTLAVVGTLFHRQDLNSRVLSQYRREGCSTMRVDVYKDKAKTEVIWPEERPLEYIRKLEVSLGLVAFNMRCRNLIQDDRERSFTEEDVDAALQRGQQWGYGVVPPGWKVMIGFDPASGSAGRGAKYPAAVVLAFYEDYIHVVAWERWRMTQPRQLEMLREWAHRYGCPVAVEDNHIQRCYREWMRELDPTVEIVNHPTHFNKRDWRQGVESFIPFFENGLITVHVDGATDQHRSELREELVQYPQARYTDLVMAMWICKYQFEKRERRYAPAQNSMPVIQRGMSTVIDVRAFRGIGPKPERTEAGVMRDRPERSKRKPVVHYYR